MNRKYIFLGILSIPILLILGCDSNSGKGKDDTPAVTTKNNSSSASTEGTNPKGIGKYKDVQLTHPLDEKMVAAGKTVYDVKCGSCHKTTDEKLVGPGWKGVTDRRTPEWIMNFVTNTDEMIEKDTVAQKLLEVCLVKMPNQNLQEADARSVLEYMRKNDGKQ
jgi:mono/diheme cytochrome c family protein